MKKRTLITATLGVLLLLAGWVVLSTVTSPTPMAFIRVVDANGRPVAGAIITPDGLRPKKGGGHYWWGGEIEREGVKAMAVTTDTAGYAKVAYPFYVHEKLETGEISFAVDHPDFCADRPFRTVAASPPANASLKEKFQYLGLRLIRRVRARPDPVVLQRGGIIKVRAHVGAKENVVPNVQADISNLWPAGTNFWQHSGATLWTKKATAGETFLRAVHCPTNGPAMFSDVVTFNATAGATNEFDLELKPGVRLSGRLDQTVARPVRNGRVCINVYVTGKDGSSVAPQWSGWRPLHADGTFVFESLPPGDLEIVGLCDGHISSNGAGRPGVGTGQRIPQSFPLTGREQRITLVMELTAACEIAVLDEAGQPLAGARAGFWPNVLWGGNGSSVFADNLYNSEDYFRKSETPDSKGIREMTKDDFHATSGTNGVALVRNLPSGNQDYSLSHTSYDMPLNRTAGSASRSASVTLSAGTINRVVVRMRKKGSETLTH